jgi:hypothetical protein
MHTTGHTLAVAASEQLKHVDLLIAAAHDSTHRALHHTCFVTLNACRTAVDLQPPMVCQLRVLRFHARCDCLLADQPTNYSAGCSQHCAVRGHLHTPQAAEHIQHLGGCSGGCHPATDGLGSSSRGAGARRMAAGSSVVLMAGEAR